MKHNKKEDNYPIIHFLMEVNSLVCEYLFLNNKLVNSKYQQEIKSLTEQIAKKQRELGELFKSNIQGMIPKLDVSKKPSPVDSRSLTGQPAQPVPVVQPNTTKKTTASKSIKRKKVTFSANTKPTNNILTSKYDEFVEYVISVIQSRPTPSHQEIDTKMRIFLLELKLKDETIIRKINEKLMIYIGLISANADPVKISVIQHDILNLLQKIKPDANFEITDFVDQQIIARSNYEYNKFRASDQSIVKYGTFTNIGGTSCYLNTSLQLLYSIDTFREFLLKFNFQEIQENTNYTSETYSIEDYKNDILLLRILQIIFILLMRGMENINLLELGLYTSLVELSGLHCYEQEDASQFIYNIIGRPIFTKLYMDYELVKRFINSMSHNHVEYKKCASGKLIPIDKAATVLATGRQYATSIQLQIAIKWFGKTDIQKLLEEYQKETQLNETNRKLDVCTSETNPDGIAISTRTDIIIFKETKYLIIGLNRFNDYGDKITDIIQANSEIAIKTAKFKLIGIACHTGTAKRGHYFYFKPPNTIFNDAAIEQGTPNINQLGYIFLYQRISSAAPANNGTLKTTEVPSDAVYSEVAK